MMRMLKLRADIPAYLENRLTQKWGFELVHRRFKEYVLYKKPYISDRDNDPKKKAASETIMARIPPLNLTNIDAYVPSGTSTGANDDNVVPFELEPPVFKGELTKWQKARLTKRCENIVNMFPDPYSMVGPIRTRLGIISQTLEPAERAFVLEFMEEEFPQ
jgi:hypothetical protein